MSEEVTPWIDHDGNGYPRRLVTRMKKGGYERLELLGLGLGVTCGLPWES